MNIREALAELAAAEAHYRLIFQTAPSVDHMDVGRAWDRMRKAGDAARAALAQPEPEPMFWVRLCSDGMYEGPIHNAQIEKVRRMSGAWSPLYLHAAPQPPAQPEPRPVAWQSPDGTVREDECQGEPPFDDWRPLFAQPTRPPSAAENVTLLDAAEGGTRALTDAQIEQALRDSTGGDQGIDCEGNTYLQYSELHRFVAAVRAVSPAPTLTDEQIRDLVKESGLDWHRGYAPLFDGDETNRFEVFARAIEREVRSTT